MCARPRARIPIAGDIVGRRSRAPPVSPPSSFIQNMLLNVSFSARDLAALSRRREYGVYSCDPTATERESFEGFGKDRMGESWLGERKGGEEIG